MVKKKYEKFDPQPVASPWSEFGSQTAAWIRVRVMKRAVSDRCGRTGKHDLLPTFPGRRAKEEEKCLNQNHLVA